MQTIIVESFRVDNITSCIVIYFSINLIFCDNEKAGTLPALPSKLLKALLRCMWIYRSTFLAHIGTKLSATLKCIKRRYSSHSLPIGQILP